MIVMVGIYGVIGALMARLVQKALIRESREQDIPLTFWLEIGTVILTVLMWPYVIIAGLIAAEKGMKS